MPARGAQESVRRARRCRVIEVLRLGIETRGKCLDAFGRERVAADLGFFADLQVLEVFHRRASTAIAAAPCARRANLGLAFIVMRRVPASSTLSKRNPT